MAGTHGTVRLDDFVIPYRPDKASFLVTNNHGFTDLDLAVKTETEERVVCSHMQPGCNMMVKLFASQFLWQSHHLLCSIALSHTRCLGMLVLLSFFTHQLLLHTACFICSLTNKETKLCGCVCCY